MIIKLIGGLVIAVAAILILGRWVLLIPLVLLLLYIIRLLADLFWWGKDKGKW